MPEEDLAALFEQSAPIEAPIQGEITTPTSAPQEEDLASLFEQSTPDISMPTQPMQIDPIEQYRPQGLNDADWMDIKGRVGNLINIDIPTQATMPQRDYGELLKEDVKASVPSISIPTTPTEEPRWKAVGEETLPTQPIYEEQGGLQVAKAPERPAIDALTQWKRGLLAQTSDLKTKVLNANRVFEQGGYKLLGHKKTGDGFASDRVIYKLEKDGNEFLLDEDSMESALFELAGDPASLAMTVGTAGIGRAVGLGAVSNAIDQAISKAVTGEELTVKQRAVEVGKEALLFGAGETVAKGIQKGIPAITEAVDRINTLVRYGDIKGATKVVRDDYGLTDLDIDKAFDAVKAKTKGWENLTGDDLQRAKLLATIQQQEQGFAVIGGAMKGVPKAGIETSKEISNRAKEVIKSAKQFTTNPDAIKRSIKAYEKVVGKNYGEVRKLIDTALPNYKSDLNLVDFTETLTDLNTRVIDPIVKEKLSNLSLSLSKQKTETVGDLIDTRQLFNKFYGKNQSHFESKVDKDALMSIQKTIDTKIDDAIKTLPEETGTALKGAFEDAKSKYAQMFKTQDTASYNAIFKKGASSEEIGNALVKYSKASDKDLGNVLNRLSKVQRTKAEFSIIDNMVSSAQLKSEAKAIDFRALSENIGTSKEIFKTPEAKQFIKNIEEFDKLFAKDMDLQKLASGISEKEVTNIATTLKGKIFMLISSMRFSALQRLAFSDSGRRLSLQKSLEQALQTSRSSKEFFFKASKIKGMPDVDRANLKKAIKEIAVKEDAIKAEVVKQTVKNKATIAQAKELKAKKATQKVLTEQEFKKAKFKKAKEAAEKQKLSEQAQKVKDASEPKIGGSEAEAKQEVKNVFAKSQDPTGIYKGMSKAEIAEMERLNNIPKGVSETTKVVDGKGNPLLVYHGTDKEFDKFDPNVSFDGGLWFTSDLSELKSGNVGAGGSGIIKKAYLNVEKMAGWDEYDKFSLGELISKGYDGVKLDDDYIVFADSQIKQISGKPKGMS